MFCFRVRHNLIPYLEETLDGQQMLAVAGHLARCPRCAEELRFIQSASDALRSARTPAQEPAPDLWQRVEREIAAPVPSSGRVRMMRLRGLQLVGTAAAAVVILLAVVNVSRMGLSPDGEPAQPVMEPNEAAATRAVPDTTAVVSDAARAPAEREIISPPAAPLATAPTAVATPPTVPTHRRMAIPSPPRPREFHREDRPVVTSGGSLHDETAFYRAEVPAGPAGPAIPAPIGDTVSTARAPRTREHTVAAAPPERLATESGVAGTPPMATRVPELPAAVVRRDPAAPTGAAADGNSVLVPPLRASRSMDFCVLPPGEERDRTEALLTSVDLLNSVDCGARVAVLFSYP